MKTKKVLVISHSEDGSAKLLMQRLSEIGQPHELVDLGSFSSTSLATIDFSKETSVTYRNNGSLFTSETVKSVWWRRPKGKIKASSNDPVVKYIEMESEIFVNSIFSLLNGVLWVSDPEKTRVANSKPMQLDLARRLGFRIPITLVSNDPDSVRSFIESNNTIPLIMKPVGTSYVRLSGNPKDPDHQNLSIYTKIIDKDEVMKNIERVRLCPVIFQEAAMQEFDVRVTVIGKTGFAVKIGHSEDSGAGPTNLDWRHHKLTRTYEKHELPDAIMQKCIDLVSALGLSFGAIDMCFSKEKGYVFFEINPQGQWVPSEIIAGYPISMTLAQLLSG